MRDRGQAARSEVKAKPSFQRHLIVSTAVFVASIVLVIFGAAYYVTRSMDARVQEEVNWLSQAVAQQVSDQIETLANRAVAHGQTDQTAIRQALKSYMDSQLEAVPALYYLRLENLEGEVIAQSIKGNIPPEEVDLLNRGALKPNRARSQQIELRGPADAQLRIRDYGTPVRLNERSMGQLRLGISGDYLDERMADIRHEVFRRAIFLSTTCVFIFTAIFFYVRWLVKRAQGLEAQAQEADRLAYLGTLAGGLAHEIRNPLSAMNLNIQMLEEEFRSASQKNRDLPQLFDSTKKEIRRLERLSTNFLTYTRPLHLERHHLNLREFLNDTCKGFLPQLNSLGIRLEAHLDDDFNADIQGDRDLLQQAFLNIFINAKDALLEASSETKKILVSLRRAGPEFVVEIEDNGVGIPEEQRSQIFEIFYSNKRSGTGLGLPIALQIIERHGGHIEVESEVNRFTRFKVFLPSKLPVA